MALNKVLLMGNLTRDPELRYLPNNTAVASFSIAVNESYKDKAGNKVERCDFIDCEAFAKTAENIGKFFTKGKPILIEGRLRLDTWEDKTTAQKRSKMKVIAENFHFVGGSKSDERQSEPQGRPESATPPDAYPSDAVPF